MGLVNKLKNILFEEEEVEIPVLEKKENVVSEPVMREMPKQEVKQVPDYSSFYDDTPEPIPLPQPERVVPEQSRVREEVQPNLDVVSERELFKSEKTFNFPAFDEEEFESSVPRRTTNVLEHERKLKERNSEKVQVPKKEEPRDIRTKFRPSPIISPVYGILDKNYTPEDILTREATPKALDVDSVRKKAFGTLEEEIMDIPIVSEYPETRDADNKFLEEKLEKARTIDELLKDSSDDIISVDDNNFVESVYNTNDYSNINLDDTMETSLNMDTYESDKDPLDATIDSLDEEVVLPEKTEVLEEDSLESDLFDLIDSMYENREDGE